MFRHKLITVLLAWTTACMLSARPSKMLAAEPDAPKSVRFESAVYFLSPPKVELEKQVAALQGGEFRDVFSAANEGNSDKLSVGFGKRPVAEYAPPDEKSLKYFGRGLTAEQGKQLQSCPAVWVFDFSAPRDGIGHAVKRATAFMAGMARENDVLIWDEQTREVFSPQAWKETRVEGWEADIPDISKQVTIHFYMPDGSELPRAITLGMSKFGCPDIVMNSVPRDGSRSAGSLMNTVGQLMAERGSSTVVKKELLVDLDQIRHAAFRDRMKKLVIEKGVGKSELTLAATEPLAGDPENELLELTFGKSSGKTALERQQSFLSALFGVSDHVTMVKKQDPDILAARARATEKMPEIAKKFRSGLPIGDNLLVKAPFKTPDGESEWMWIEVTDWKTEAVVGILQNKPFNVPELQSGAKVTVKQADLFDYLLRHSDGSTEGNETGKIMEKRERDGS